MTLTFISYRNRILFFSFILIQLIFFSKISFIILKVYFLSFTDTIETVKVFNSLYLHKLYSIDYKINFLKECYINYNSIHKDKASLSYSLKELVILLDPLLKKKDFYNLFYLIVGHEEVNSNISIGSLNSFLNKYLYIGLSILFVGCFFVFLATSSEEAKPSSTIKPVADEYITRRLPTLPNTPNRFTSDIPINKDFEWPIGVDGLPSGVNLKNQYYSSSDVDGVGVFTYSESESECASPESYFSLNVVYSLEDESKVEYMVRVIYSLAREAGVSNSSILDFVLSDKDAYLHLEDMAEKLYKLHNNNK